MDELDRIMFHFKTFDKLLIQLYLFLKVGSFLKRTENVLIFLLGKSSRISHVAGLKFGSFGVRRGGGLEAAVGFAASLSGAPEILELENDGVKLHNISSILPAKLVDSMKSMPTFRV